MERIEPTTQTPAKLLESIADESGLAIVITGESGSVSKSNNNSICEHLYSSEEFAPRCAEFCGRAFQMATEAGGPVPYQCHAGLDCLAVPLKTEKPLVAIVGRTFTKGENFEQATKRAFEGDWQAFPPEDFFENVLINGSSKVLETAAKRLEGLGGDVLENRSKPPAVADGLKEKTKSIDEQAAKTDDLNKLIE